MAKIVYVYIYIPKNGESWSLKYSETYLPEPLVWLCGLYLHKSREDKETSGDWNVGSTQLDQIWGHGAVALPLPHQWGNLFLFAQRCL